MCVYWTRGVLLLCSCMNKNVPNKECVCLQVVLLKQAYYGRSVSLSVVSTVLQSDMMII